MTLEWKCGGGAFAILFLMAGIAAAADQPGIRAVVKPPSDRSLAPQFVLTDSSGKAARLDQYGVRSSSLISGQLGVRAVRRRSPGFPSYSGSTPRKA